MKYLVIFFLLLMSGCKSPELPPLTNIVGIEASFDENSQDSGIKEYIPGVGFILSDKAVSRYKKLAEIFQEEPIGLSIKEGKNVLTNEGMVLFLSLNDRNLNR